MSDVILRAIIPVAFIILVGYLAGRIFAPDVQSLSQVTVYIFAPALILDSLYRTQLSAQNAIGILLSFALISLLLYGLVNAIAKFFQLSSPIYKSLLATTIVPNNGNMGLPITDFAMGFQGLERAVIYLIGSSILLFGILPALLKGKGMSYSLHLIFKLPLIWAMLMGLGLRFFSIQLPDGIVKSIGELGRASIPVSLIILGIQLANTGFKISQYELFVSPIRLLLAPLLSWGVGWSMGLRDLDLQVLIIQSAMPTAVNSVVLVSEFGGDAAKVARTVITTTLLSFLTLPLILWVVQDL